MTFIETLLHIQSQGDNVLANDLNSIITKHHRYIRVRGDVSNWVEDTLPGAPLKQYGRGGEYYVWQRKEEADDKPASFPEGT
jgi:hypothetical protein